CSYVFYQPPLLLIWASPGFTGDNQPRQTAVLMVCQLFCMHAQIWKTVEQSCAEFLDSAIPIVLSGQGQGNQSFTQSSNHCRVGQLRVAYMFRQFSIKECHPPLIC